MRKAPTEISAETKALRAKKKRERLDAPTPELSDQLQEYTLDDLRKNKTTLVEHETQVSYWRRILHARIDLTKKGKNFESLKDLANILADAPSQSHRVASLAIIPVDSVPPLPDLAELWKYSPVTEEETVEYLEKLSVRERDLSDYRRALHIQIDAIQKEMIARYHENPTLALSVLPSRKKLVIDQKV